MLYKDWSGDIGLQYDDQILLSIWFDEYDTKFRREIFDNNNVNTLTAIHRISQFAANDIKPPIFGQTPGLLTCFHLHRKKCKIPRVI